MAKNHGFDLTAIGVALFSLGYGVNPVLGMLLYGIDIESVNQPKAASYFGLYLAISLYWIIGALNENVKLSSPGVCSFLVTVDPKNNRVYLDGTPSTILFFLFIEIISSFMLIFYL